MNDEFATASRAPQAPLSTPLAPDQERLWATLSHVLSFVAAYVALGFVAPLIVMLVFGRRSAFVRHHSVESLNFQLTALLFSAVAIALTLITLGFGALFVLPVAGVYAIFYVIVVIIATLRANEGRDYRYPLTIRFLKP